MQRAFDAIDRAGVVLPIVAIALIVTGVLLARDRRGATIRAGAGLIIAMVVLAVAILIGRNVYLEASTASSRTRRQRRSSTRW
jgi:hypothetical protein